MRGASSFFILCIVPLVLSLPLPSAYYEVPPRGSTAGDMLSAEAKADIANFQGLLLNDPKNYTDANGKVQSWPYPRIVMNADDYNVTSGDGQDDGVALAKFYKAVCDKSQLYYYQVSLTWAALSSKLPPAYANVSRPVLVEARFKANGTYDIGQGLWYYGVCKYVLFNFQNSTVLTHFEPSWVNQQKIPGNAANGEPQWDTQQLFPGLYNSSLSVRYILNVNQRSATPSNTLGTVTQLLKDSNGVTVGIRLQALPDYPAISNASAAKSSGNYAQHTDALGQNARREAPYGRYNGQTCNFTADLEGQLGGMMTVYFTWDSLQLIRVAPFIAVGQYWGLTTGRLIQLGDNFKVVQGVNTVGLPGWFQVAPSDVDIIDVHQDRLAGYMFVQGGGLGQISSGGNMRLWHSSLEAGSDDAIDILTINGDVYAVYPDNNTVLIKVMSGAWKNNSLTCPNLYSRVAFAQWPRAFTYTAFATVIECNQTTTGNMYTSLRLNSTAGISVGDFFYQLDNVPANLHIKNVRLGYHQYNGLTVKGYTVLIENSYFSHMMGTPVTLGADAMYWREGNKISNITVRNCTFLNNFGGIYFDMDARGATPSNWVNDDHRFDMITAPTAADNVMIYNNVFIANLTDTVGLIDGWSTVTQLYLRAIEKLSIYNNTFVITPGMSQARGYMGLANINGGFIGYNSVEYLPLVAGQYAGENCRYTSGSPPVCPVWNVSNFVTLYKNTPPQITGFLYNTSGDDLITYTCNGFAAVRYASDGSGNTVSSSTPFGFCPYPTSGSKKRSLENSERPVPADQEQRGTADPLSVTLLILLVTLAFT